VPALREACSFVALSHAMGRDGWGGHVAGVRHSVALEHLYRHDEMSMEKCGSHVRVNIKGFHHKSEVL